MVILSGTSAPALSQKIAEILKIPVVKREIGRFPGGEIRVRILDDLSRKTVVLLQSLENPIHDHLMELLLLADATKRCGSSRVIVLIPYLGYSKQDQIFRSGEPLSSRVIAQAINTAGYDRAVLLELHNENILTFFRPKAADLSLKAVFADKMKPTLQENALVISPDDGGLRRSLEFANLLGAPFAKLSKTRDLATGEVRIHRVSIPVSGRQCFIFDDMISTGATVVEAAAFLSEAGARSITVCATHGLFTKGWESFVRARIDRLLVSDSVPLPAGAPTYVEVVSAAPMFAQTLREYERA